MRKVKIQDGKFLCGFCCEVTTKTVMQSVGNGKHKVSDQIQCKCGSYIPQANQLT